MQSGAVKVADCVSLWRTQHDQLLRDLKLNSIVILYDTAGKMRAQWQISTVIKADHELFQQPDPK